MSGRGSSGEELSLKWWDLATCSKTAGFMDVKFLDVRVESDLKFHAVTAHGAFLLRGRVYFASLVLFFSR